MNEKRTKTVPRNAGVYISTLMNLMINAAADDGN